MDEYMVLVYRVTGQAEMIQSFADETTADLFRERNTRVNRDGFHEMSGAPRNGS